MPFRRLTAGFAAWMTGLTVAYFLLPQLHVILWGAIAFSSSLAIMIGVRVNKPRRRWPWYALATSMFLLGGGDTAFNFQVDVLHMTNPFPSVADVIYLLVYPFIALGVLGLIRSRIGSSNRGGLLDAVTLTVGMALLSWIFLIVPYIRKDQLTVLEKVVSVGYPLGDVIALATFARLLTIGGQRSRSVGFLVVGACGMFVADVLYGLDQLRGSWEVGGPVDFGWVVLYAFWGLAALDPTMARVTEPTRGGSADLSGRRISMLGAVSLIAPAALLVETVLGEVRDAATIAVCSGVMFLLVLARLSGMMANHRQALVRERGLRAASAALVSAADSDAALAAVGTTLAGLLPPGTPHAVVLLDGAEPGQHSAEFVRTSDLPAALRAQLGDFPSALRCPLTPEVPVADAGLGRVLYLTAPESALLALHGTLEVLAGQAAIALDRIALTGEINRRNSEAYFRTLIHNTSDVILIVGDDDRIRYSSPSAATVFGDEYLAGTSVWDLVVADHRPQLTETLEQVRAGLWATSARTHLDLTAVRVDGTELDAEVDCRDLRDDHTVNGLVLTVRDVTERRRLERQLIKQAFHDSLTGLANRVLFQDRVEQAVARACRDHGLVGVLFVDLDDFKVVNDTVGHALGDALLVAAAERLTATLRPGDTVARLGGDEFAVLVEDATTLTDLEDLAEELVEALGRPFTLDGETVSGGASIGLGTTVDAHEAAQLLRQADLALYVAKGAGKGRWRRYQSDLHTVVLERLELRAALDQAVTDEQFMLQYQPIVDLEAGVPAGFEALVRWQHPTRGTIPPANFIEVAEESGLIVPIGRWVLRQALMTAGRWLRAVPGGRFRYLSVNVSARQFRARGFVDDVRQALADADVPPGMLLLEITESLLLRDDEQVRADLAALRALGVRLAIDDFGTGYSSLSYLRQMPIDVLKIDKSFIDDMANSKQQRAVVTAIVRLAQTLDLAVVAEGVEDRDQRDLLQHMGCPYGQGYLFAKPLPEHEAFAMFSAVPLRAA
jgi:diguanylate cyclase (GGDEF)-like protein/PAS domain S-box-containing protein